MKPRFHHSHFCSRVVAGASDLAPQVPVRDEPRLSAPGAAVLLLGVGDAEAADC